MNTIDKSSAWQTVRVLFFTTLGSLLCGFSMNAFYVPGNLINSGLSGVTLLLNYQFGLPLGITNFTLTIPLMILAWFFLGKRLFFLNLYGTVVFSLSMEIFTGISIPFNSTLPTVVLGGLIYGIGLGTIYRSGGIAGGVDIIARILNKYYDISMATTSLVFNTIVIVIFMFIKGLDLTVLTLITAFISSKADEYVLNGLDRRRAIFIITEHKDELAQAILSQVGRGITILPAEGAYTHQEHAVLYCVVSPWQVGRLKRIIRSVDPGAFFTITETVGVYGRGHGFHKIADIDS
jgi:uncharacterized membrane-anchored protein YitT (DUF2179 family)